MGSDSLIFDHVIIGAGSAGSILAARLSEDGTRSVALIEAGGDDTSPWLRIPVGFAKCYYNPVVNWMHYTEPQAELGDRRLYCPRGKVLGGSGAINAMIYLRGAPWDFDGWCDAGNPGWGWQDVLPVFKAMETHADGASDWHGDNGPIHITPMRGHEHPISQAFLQGCTQAGLPLASDFNGSSLDGAGIYDVNTRKGWRSSSGSEYLRGARKRGNLQIMTNARALRLVFDGIDSKRINGVEVAQGETRQTITARAGVVLCAGAIETPRLLAVSGIGDGAWLAAAGVSLRHHLPGVGANLQDHLCASFYYRATVPTLNGAFGSLFGQAGLFLRWLFARSGPFAMSVNQAGGFFRSDPAAPHPDTQLYFNPLSYRLPADPKAGLKAEPYPGFLLAYNGCYPTSRGRVDITSPDITDSPVIQPNYLSTEADQQQVIRAARLVRRIMDSPALQAITEAELPPSAGAQTDAELLDFFRANCGSIYHPCGTAAMGADPATGAVVDAQLRLHGMDGLHIADASIFPRITAGNINAPVMMVAEKCAAMLRSAR